MNPLLLVDSYKIHHTNMYPEGMTKLYSNFTPRKSRIKGIESVVTFGLQHFIKEYLINKFNKEFFGKRVYTKLPAVTENLHKSSLKFKSKVIEEYKRHCNVDTKHIENLWDLGYLPIEIKALEEGMLCPIGVPMLTITNTHPDFGWLVNYLETLLSCMLWQPITSATIAYEYKKILNKYALETTGTTDGVQWQGHDFSMRGMSSVESAVLSGMGHLLSFTGTDTIPAIYTLEDSYRAEGLIGASVPATEHSVMCMGTKEAEVDTFKRLLDLYPEGILSVVSDTWNLWDVVSPGGLCEQLKDQILARNGKLVIRPDSGNPVKIITGYTLEEILEENGKYFEKGKYISHKDPQGYEVWGSYEKGKELSFNEIKGTVELLWDVFDGTVNEQGYKVLDSHIGCIYGDGIGLHNVVEIMERLKAKGFASTNIVLGFGSYGYQYNTRDTFGFAMKATYGEVNGEGREIFKDPITDDGTKKSKKGLLQVNYEAKEPNGWNIVCYDQQTWQQESEGLLTTIFKDGKLVKETTLEEIRQRINSTL